MPKYTTDITSRLPLSLDLSWKLAQRLAVLWELRICADCTILLRTVSDEANLGKEIHQGDLLKCDCFSNKPPDESRSNFCQLLQYYKCGHQEILSIQKVHTAVLLASSDYFAKRLNPQNNGTDLNYIDGAYCGETLLVERIHPDELSAFLTMLEFFYTAEIDMDSWVEAFKLLQVADRFGATLCITAVIELMIHRASLPVPLSDRRLDVAKVFSLPQHFSSFAGWEDLIHLATKQLLTRFGNLSTVLTSPELLSSWCLLPAEAVIVTLTTEECDRDCEETIACLLDCWLNLNLDFRFLDIRHQSEITGAFCQHVLCSDQLSEPFLSGLMYEGSWMQFSLPGSMDEWKATSTGTANETRPSKRQGKLEPDVAHKGLGLSTAMSTIAYCFQCGLEVSAFEIEGALMDMPTCISGPNMYIRGWFLQLNLEIDCDNGFMLKLVLKNAAPSFRLESVDLHSAKCTMISPFCNMAGSSFAPCSVSYRQTLFQSLGPLSLTSEGPSGYCWSYCILPHDSLAAWRSLLVDNMLRCAFSFQFLS